MAILQGMPHAFIQLLPNALSRGVQMILGVVVFLGSQGLSYFLKAVRAAGTKHDQERESR
jgi:ABC-type phosphate transport system auxiliary subunit